jgi:beta-glucosidase
LAIFVRGTDDNNGPRKHMMATNKIIAEYADNKHIFFLNINDGFLDKNRVLHKSIMPDPVHPSPEGYRIWAEAMEPTVKKLMGK